MNTAQLLKPRAVSMECGHHKRYLVYNRDTQGKPNLVCSHPFHYVKGRFAR